MKKEAHHNLTNSFVHSEPCQHFVFFRGKSPHANIATCTVVTEMLKLAGNNIPIGPFLNLQSKWWIFHYRSIIANLNSEGGRFQILKLVNVVSF